MHDADRQSGVSSHRSTDFGMHGAAKMSRLELGSDLRGHPFMTSTRRRRGGQAQVDACGRGEVGSSPMWTSTPKIKKSPLMSSCLLLMQRSWCLFYQNFVFRRNKKLKIFCDMN